MDTQTCEVLQPELVIVGKQPGSIAAVCQPVPLSRVEGYDLARALAILGMILVNYHSIFFGHLAAPDWADPVVCLYGRAAALFVMLAGVGVALMSRRALASGDRAAIRTVRSRLLKRSLVLFGMGLLFKQFWGGDILRFYGIFLSIASCLLLFSGRDLWLLSLACFSIAVGYFCFTEGYAEVPAWSADPAWGSALLIELFLEGYYAVFPWLVFLLIGLWLGRGAVLSSRPMRNRLLLAALVVLAVAENASSLILPGPEGLAPAIKTFLGLLLTSNVFPAFPLFAVSAAASSLAVIMLALFITDVHYCQPFLGPLKSAGRLSLTIYIVHIAIGLAAQKLIEQQVDRALYPVAAAFFTAFFCLATVWLAACWLRCFPVGPLEWLLRRLSGAR